MPRQSVFTVMLQQLEQTTVVNLGTSGYGPQQELAVLKRYALSLHPRTPYGPSMKETISPIFSAMKKRYEIYKKPLEFFSRPGSAPSSGRALAA